MKLQFRKFNTESKARDTLTLALIRNKIRKNTLADLLEVSYPTILYKLENPYSMKVSELLKIVDLIEDITIEDITIKY